MVVQKLSRLAQSGRFDEVLARATETLQSAVVDFSSLLQIGALLSNCGLLSTARVAFERARQASPSDLRPILNIANLEREAGNHAEARRIYTLLTDLLPNEPLIRRNLLCSLEYDPEVQMKERFQLAQEWGKWAIQQTGGPRSRPTLRPLMGRPLQLGYVSADFCQHTVGLFIRHILRAHDPRQFHVVTYGVGKNNDWVTDDIRSVSQWRDVSGLSASALAEQIQHDNIDILVDLSGHTAGSRLEAFAYRPAPVQVSWLGYFATTGLPYIDAVLLDKWHAPPRTEAQFTERIIRLSNGRLCYQPVPFSPDEVSLPPYIRNGYITFGCFNNTTKINKQVISAWSRILHSIPHSRLLLKWRTFNDPEFRSSILKAFSNFGIVANRVELRGPSFHADLLKEYADIDIALDPFPFTGGLTSCEALWMGVPIITWPQNRVVSRQTFSFLSMVGLSDLAGDSADDYVRLAVELSQDRERLSRLRVQIRDKMRHSSLMDVASFARGLEDALTKLFQTVALSPD